MMGCFQTMFSVLLISIISAAGGVEATNTAPRDAHSQYRLPTNLIPYHYDLRLEPSVWVDTVDQLDFSGSVTIFFTCVSATNVITLHQDGLNIYNGSIKVTRVSGPATSHAVSHVTVESQFHFYKIHLHQPLEAEQEYALKIPYFRGKMSKDPIGLYYSSYIDGPRIVYFAATRMEPTYCRRVFPSFDEPALKATFNVTLVRYDNTPRNYMLLFNTPPAKETYLFNYLYEVTFERTERMSTYQLAFIVSDFDYHETISSSVKIRTYAPVNQYSDSLAIHNEAVKAFNHLEDLFDPSYGSCMGKLDLVAIPSPDLQNTGSWGLVMFNEKLLKNFTHGPDVSSLTVNPLTKALAHLWFGNMVTPKWWTWLWLSDAFASYWENYITGQLCPDSKKGPVHRMIHNRDDDDPDSSLPLSNPVESPEEILMQYNEINKFRGPAIVRMMHLIMGRHFVPALNRFLKDNLHGSVDHQDLFDSLNEYIRSDSGIVLDMAWIMEPWVTQTGYPVVSVERQTDSVILRQRQYLVLSAPGMTNDNRGNMFEIPITYTTSSEDIFEAASGDVVWLPATENPEEFPVRSEDSWVVLNLLYSGYYAVNYNHDLWATLIDQLKANHMLIHVVNRAGIMHDAFRLAKADMLSFLTALRTVEYMEREEDLELWLLFLQLLQNDMRMDLIGRSAMAEQFKKFMQKTLDKFVKRHTLLPLPSTVLVQTSDSDYPKLAMMTEKIRNLACEYGQDDCSALANALLVAWRNGSPNPIRDDLRSMVYSAAVREGGSDVWHLIYQRSRAEQDKDEKYMLYYALGDASNTSLIHRFLHLCLEKAKVGNTILLACGVRVAGNRYGVDVLLDFVAANVDTIRKRVDESQLLPMLYILSNHLSTQNHLKQLQTIRGKTNHALLLTWLDKFEERVTTNFDWMEKNEVAITEWLTES